MRPHPTTNATQLLQAALQADPHDIALLVAAMQPFDWPIIANLAQYHEVVPLLWHNLRAHALPDELAIPWKATYYHTAVRNDARITELQAIYRDLAAHSIVPIVLKGMALASLVYRNIALRPMGDMDILVQRHDLAVTWAVLSARRYLVPRASQRYWRLQFRNSGELRLVHQRSTALVEVHWWLCAGTWAEQTGLLTRFDPWGRARVATLDEQPVLRLHPHDEVLHIAYHLAVNNQFGRGVGRMLVDLDRLVRVSEIDWTSLFAEARHLGLATMLWLVLDLAHTLLNTPIGNDYAQLAPPFGQRTLLRKLVQPQALLHGHDPRQVALRRYVLLLLLFDRPCDMLGMVWRGLGEFAPTMRV